MPHAHQKEANKQLVRALINGDADTFDNLLRKGIEVEGETYRAEIDALAGDMKEYVKTRDFNVGEPKDHPGSRAILRRIHANNPPYNAELDKIQLPALAAHFCDAELMQQLVTERQNRTRMWDFNGSIGERPTTPLSTSITAGRNDIAYMLIDNAREIGVNTDNTRLGLAYLYTTQQYDQLRDYLTRLPRVHSSDLTEMVNVIYNGIHTESEKSASIQEIRPVVETNSLIVDHIFQHEERPSLVNRLLANFNTNEDPPKLKGDIATYMVENLKNKLMTSIVEYPMEESHDLVNQIQSTLSVSTPGSSRAQTPEPGEIPFSRTPSPTIHNKIRGLVSGLKHFIPKLLEVPSRTTTPEACSPSPPTPPSSSKGESPSPKGSNRFFQK